MTIISSISGIRGTIGGGPGDNLTPVDIVNFSSAYGCFIKLRSGSDRPKVVIGRDARISGEIITNIVSSTLNALGVDVIDIGLSTTPTVGLSVLEYHVNGGVMVTASHNPREWNALKLFNENGEFLSEQDGEYVLNAARKLFFNYADVDNLGVTSKIASAIDIHIKKILSLELVKPDLIRESNFKVVVDGINSSGGIFVPYLLNSLGVSSVIKLNCDPTGDFSHNPEPLPENLSDISSTVTEFGADMGIVVDPDVDRLAFVCEDGSMFGEEYTIVAVANYVLQYTPGNTVSNISSSMALKDITERYENCSYSSSKVGEVNVVNLMKDTNSVIGGEGNGGVIYPALHYGRDALVGIALFLSYLAELKCSLSNLRKSFPNYYMVKDKITINNANIDEVIEYVASEFNKDSLDRKDGLRIDFDSSWVQLRKSNTEPVVRIYAESKTVEGASNLVGSIKMKVKEYDGSLSL